MCMTWSTAGTLQYGPDLVLGISDLVQFTPIWSDLVQFGNESDPDITAVDFSLYSTGTMIIYDRLGL